MKKTGFLVSFILEGTLPLAQCFKLISGGGGGGGGGHIYLNLDFRQIFP